MSNGINNGNRRKKIIDICLKKFLEKGPFETTSRELTNALDMQPSALYYHFKSKDDAVLECAEEAAIRLESTLLQPVIDLLDDKRRRTDPPEENFEDMQAMMRFFAQVCAADKYREQMKPILNRMREREYAYCEKFAEKLGCTAAEVAPWLFAITASSQSYMLFGEDAYSVKPLDFTKPAIRLIKEKYAQKAKNSK